MAVAKKIPYIIDKPMGFCPGCGHGVVIRLIAESLEELGQDNNIILESVSAVPVFWAEALMPIVNIALTVVPERCVPE